MKRKDVAGHEQLDDYRFDNPRGLKSFLRARSKDPSTRDQEFAIVAARVALRVFPLLINLPVNERGSEFHFETMLEAFFCVSASLTAVVQQAPSAALTAATSCSFDAHQANGNPIVEPTLKAVGSAGVSVRYLMPGSSRLTRLVAGDSVAACGGYAADAVSRAAARFGTATPGEAAKSARNLIWKSVSTDVGHLVENRCMMSLAESPLWSTDCPTLLEENSFMLQAVLRADKGSFWEVWIDWYSSRLRGGPFNSDMEVQRATMPLEVRRAGPREANREIAQQILRSQL